MTASQFIVLTLLLRSCHWSEACRSIKATLQDILMRCCKQWGVLAHANWMNCKFAFFLILPLPYSLSKFLPFSGLLNGDVCLQDWVVVLDERGKDVTSEKLANLIAKARYRQSSANISCSCCFYAHFPNLLHNNSIPHILEPEAQHCVAHWRLTIQLNAGTSTFKI